MPKTSAGILPYRQRDQHYEVLLVHPGGPFWAHKDLGSWSIAKGEYEKGEDPLQAALRECAEETGYRPTGALRPLTPRRQPSGKVIDVWATEGDWDETTLVSNTCRLEWPRGSGRWLEVPEVDRAAWFDFDEALQRILPGQRGFIEELFALLAGQASARQGGDPD